MAVGHHYFFIIFILDFMIRSVIIFFCCNIIFSLKLTFFQEFFFRAAHASQFTYSTYVLDSSPSSVNASRLGLFDLFNKNYRFVGLSYKFVNCCFVYLIAGPESFN